MPFREMRNGFIFFNELHQTQDLRTIHDLMTCVSAT